MDQLLQIQHNSSDDVSNYTRKSIHESVDFFFFFIQLIAWGNLLWLEGLLLAWGPSVTMEWACPVRLELLKELCK